ncbi:TonB-dependent SusC/RagA subfamily outer membrane receptor [Algoriphagus boseongensis]|uniref:TonB-dependent SusC/RagA subfamily outer membrane receptor n=1 Tax=Algoriphagus boseongensis TaxID=1442587 RepID=A0A4R6T2S5_9BACT|nr:TonB-dependent receptor plug domain-containing protein [Algoriphagus boseongensis]TDQ13695.1 TonB-dependent SusC/RagA subfamily outer membrane receptor [Algoriphagus boseongensis]
MSKRLWGVFLSAFSLVSVPTLAQEELPTKIQNYFNSYQEEFPVEKAYLQLDKYTYTLGEEAWFSAYLVAGGVQVPSPLSKTLYVDIFDGDGLLLTQKTIQIENGRGAGSYLIPRFGKTGIYQIRAYTTWMRNFGEEYFFQQTITVIDGQGGSFLPQLDFTSIQAENGKTRYQAELKAITSSGNPLSNQEIALTSWSNGEEVYSQKIQLNNQGQASFSFSIPTGSFPDQHLELTFQENPDYAVSQKIKLPYSLHQADIQFLPEGGNWVLGKKSILAFRAVYPDGSPANITGFIEGIEDSNFESQFGGLGKIELTPTQKELFAVIREKNSGEEIRIPLPKVEEKGLAIQVQNNSGASYISAIVQGNLESGSLLLVSHTRGLINYMIQGQLTNGVWGVRIPKQNLPSGINTITVLDNEGRPLLERLVFIQNPDRLDLEVEKVGSLSKRGKLKLDLSSKWGESPATGSFSVAVADASQVTDETLEHGSIFSHLLLSSDLQGKIYRPGYYFKDQEQETLAELDLLMLTHGWRRFNWEDIKSEKFPDNGFFIEEGITLTGQVKEQNQTKKGLGGGKISALVGEGIELIGSEFGPDGKFIFSGLNYTDSATVTLTAEDSRVKNFIDLFIDRPEPPFKRLKGTYPSEISWPKELAESYQARMLMQELNSKDKITDLEGITVEAKTLQEEQTSGRKLYGEGDASINPDEIPGSVGYTNIFQMIQGRVAGVRVNINGFDVSVQIRGVGSIQAGTAPLYLLDNVPVDAGLLFQVNPRDVQSIEVFKDPAKTAIFGTQGANGVIAVYTKTGAGLSYESVGGNLVLKYGGYDLVREFYSPKYDTQSPSTTDERATIYWNPKIETSESGKASFEFFNSDIAQKLLLIIEGMDSQGRLGRLVKILE